MTVFSLEDYEHLRQRHEELTGQLRQIGEEYQALGRALSSGPEWALFTNQSEGYKAQYGLARIRFFKPELLMGPEKITQLVKELHQLYDDLDTAYAQLSQRYSSSIKEPPRPAKLAGQ